MDLVHQVAASTSVPPPDLAQPRFHLTLSRGPAGRRALRPPPTRHGPAPAPQILGQGPQADRAPARVDTSRVLERQGTQVSVLVPIELRSVALRSALKSADPILEHGDLERRDLALAHAASEQGQAPAHERRVPDRVLQDEPRGSRAVLAYARATGPAMGVDERCQSRGIALMQRFH